jgi:hypothetical protein
MTIWCTRIACWITKATNTQSEYVIVIAFPREQWLRERASMLRYSTMPILFQSALFYLLLAGIEGYCYTLSHSDTPHSLGLLWTRDRPVT